MKNVNSNLKRIFASGILIGTMVVTATSCGNNKKVTTSNNKINSITSNSNNKTNDGLNTLPASQVKEKVEDTNNKIEKFDEFVKKQEVKEEIKEEVKEEVKEEIKEETINIEEIRNEAKVSYEEYEKAYLNFYQKYGESLSFNSIDSIVYYMNYNNVTSDTLNQIVDKYISNDSSIIISNTATVKNDIVNYNINAKLASRSKETINLSEAIVDENEKRGMEYIESLIDVIAKGTDDEALDAYRELHSIVVYNDADVSNEIGTDYDKASFNELNAGEQYMVKVAYLPEAAVLAFERKINEKTYFYDSETNTVITSTIHDDLCALARDAVNPLAMDCKKLVLK